MEKNENNQAHNNHYEQPTPQSQPYNPDANAYWYQDPNVVRKYAKAQPWSKKKKIGLGLLIALGALVYIGGMLFSFYIQRYVRKRVLSNIVNNPNIINTNNFNNLIILPEKVQTELWNEARIVSTEIENAIESYQAENGSKDLTGLDVPAGTLREGFVNGSPLFDKLNLDYNALAQQPNFDPGDYYILFTNNGIDGKYKIVCDSKKGIRNGKDGNGISFNVLVYNHDDGSMYLQGYEPEDFPKR